MSVPAPAQPEASRSSVGADQRVGAACPSHEDEPGGRGHGRQPGAVSASGTLQPADTALGDREHHRADHHERDEQRAGHVEVPPGPRLPPRSCSPG